MARNFQNATLFTGDKTYDRACIAVDDGLVVDILEDNAVSHTSEESVDLDGHRLVAGFVDIQVNGGGGILFNNDPTVDAIRAIGDAHTQFGTTAFLPTLISDDFAVMQAGIAAVREAMEQRVPGVLGIHLEGPFLNPRRNGAHNTAKFRTLDDEAIELLTSLDKGAVTLVTLAPELTDTRRIRQLSEAGIIVFAGHTAASFEECQVAEAAGITGYTHLFNAMTPFCSRAPGVVGAAIDSPNSVFSIIADGHHTHPTTFKIACRAKHHGGVILVTDAMATVGSDVSSFQLYGERIELADDILRNSEGSLAGSNLTMIDAVRNAMEFGNIEWRDAVCMASCFPAQAVNVQRLVGSIKVGLPADFVELDNDMNIIRVWRHGKVAFTAS